MCISYKKFKYCVQFCVVHKWHFINSLETHTISQQNIYYITTFDIIHLFTNIPNTNVTGILFEETHNFPDGNHQPYLNCITLTYTVIISTLLQVSERITHVKDLPLTNNISVNDFKKEAIDISTSNLLAQVFGRHLLHQA